LTNIGEGVQNAKYQFGNNNEIKEMNDKK